MGDNPYDVIQWQQGITLDLCVDVLPLSAGRQQLHQRDVIPAEDEHNFNFKLIL